MPRLLSLKRFPHKNRVPKNRISRKSHIRNLRNVAHGGADLIQDFRGSFDRACGAQLLAVPDCRGGKSQSGKTADRTQRDPQGFLIDFHIHEKHLTKSIFY